MVRILNAALVKTLRSNQRSVLGSERQKLTMVFGESNSELGLLCDSAITLAQSTYDYQVYD